ncbi:hypothetical protein [Bartonella apis]|uniref:hypothetical protein n=1 Tax=Bartonella apis TaxID=1686310 RepID=UPI0018DAF6DF|nr:hypothetical protein [Bartonella apis]MBI0177577.1 hypothetical protein [Bartonella apis]
MSRQSKKNTAKAAGVKGEISTDTTEGTGAPATVLSPDETGGASGPSAIADTGTTQKPDEPQQPDRQGGGTDEGANKDVGHKYTILIPLKYEGKRRVVGDVIALNLEEDEIEMLLNLGFIKEA